MARLSKRTAKSKQNATLRYIASTDIERSAGDLGVSTKQLRRFLGATPETIQKNPERYRRLLDADTREVARRNDIRLVQRLSGKRLEKLSERQLKSERQIRTVTYSRAVRERRREVEDGKIIYRPVAESDFKPKKAQILNNMAGMNSASIMDMRDSGQITDDEARGLIRKLYANSGIGRKIADKAYDRMKG